MTKRIAVVGALLVGIAGALSFVPKSAHAGEPVTLGVITTVDAGCANNVTSLSGAFRIGPKGTLISIQTYDAGAWVQTSSGWGGPKKGLFLPAGAAIQSSIDINATDAGTYGSVANPGGLVACCPEQGQTFAECIINKSY